MAAIRRGKGDVIPVAPQSADTPSRPESPSGPGGSGAFLEHSQSNSNSNSNNSANKNNSPRNQFGGPGLSASSGGFAFGVEGGGAAGGVGDGGGGFRGGGGGGEGGGASAETLNLLSDRCAGLRLLLLFFSLTVCRNWIFVVIFAGNMLLEPQVVVT